MRFRIELFVDDLDESIRFYEAALGFRLTRREAEYASLELEGAVLGLGSITKLPADGKKPGFARRRLAGVRGAGVEIVLEVPKLDAALHAVERAGNHVAEARATALGVGPTSESPTPTATTCRSHSPDVAAADSTPSPSE